MEIDKDLEIMSDINSRKKQLDDSDRKRNQRQREKELQIPLSMTEEAYKNMLLNDEKLVAEIRQLEKELEQLKEE